MLLSALHNANFSHLHFDLYVMTSSPCIPGQNSQLPIALPDLTQLKRRTTRDPSITCSITRSVMLTTENCFPFRR